MKSLNGKMRGGSGVVQSIVDDVHATLGGLRQQLLHSTLTSISFEWTISYGSNGILFRTALTENTSLPKEIQILATLRKLDSLLIER